jgi:hypothetical protein
VVLVIASNLYYFHDALVAWWKTALFILFTISAINMILDCAGISMIGCETALERDERAIIWAVLPPDWIFGVVCEISFASLFVSAGRTQSLQIAHHIRFAPGQSIAIQVQRVHPAQ